MHVIAKWAHAVAINSETNGEINIILKGEPTVRMALVFLKNLMPAGFVVACIALQLAHNCIQFKSLK